MVAHRQRARENFRASFWKNGIGSLLVGGIFALTGIGGGYGGPSYGPPVAQLTGLKVLIVIVIVASLLLLAILSTARYVVELRRIKKSEHGPAADTSMPSTC
jgi:hypothetical protein